MRQLWWIGDTEHEEFVAAWADLQTERAPQNSGASPRVFAQPEEAWAALATADAPELFLFAGRYPGDLPAAAVANLQAAAPLTRSIALLGSLCEGESRTGMPWPGVVRYYWHQWRWRLAPLLRSWQQSAELLSTRSAPPSAQSWPDGFPWDLPLTATEDERVLVQTPPAVVTTTKAPLIGVVGHDAAGVETVTALVRAAGYHAVALSPAMGRSDPPALFKYPGLAACVWDGCGPLDRQWAELTNLVHGFSPLPVVAAVSFLRQDQLERAYAAGVKAVLSKPYHRADLAAVVAYALKAVEE